MEIDIRKQFYVAEKIKKVRLKDWYQKVKPHVLEYVADYLFHRKGEVAQMVEFNENYGFVYNPEILENGIDMLIRVLESARNGDEKKAQSIYSTIANPTTRISYLWRIIDKFDIFHAIGEQVIKDLDEYANETQDPELLDTIDARKRNIRARAEMERKEKKPSGWQP